LVSLLHVHCVNHKVHNNAETQLRSP